MFPHVLVSLARCHNVLVNGAFGNGVALWGEVNTPDTFENVNGRAHIVHNGANSGFNQAVTLEVNEDYILSFDYQVVRS